MSAARAVEVVKDTVKLRALPEAAPVPKSGMVRYMEWFKINREPLGFYVLAASLLIRGMLFLPHHTDIADFLKGLVDIFAILGAGTYAAGKFPSDKAKVEEIHTEIKRRSGQIPAFERRGH